MEHGNDIGTHGKALVMRGHVGQSYRGGMPYMRTLGRGSVGLIAYCRVLHLLALKESCLEGVLSWVLDKP